MNLESEEPEDHLQVERIWQAHGHPCFNKRGIVGPIRTVPVLVNTTSHVKRKQASPPST